MIVEWQLEGGASRSVCTGTAVLCSSTARMAAVRVGRRRLSIAPVAAMLPPRRCPCPATPRTPVAPRTHACGEGASGAASADATLRE